MDRLDQLDRLPSNHILRFNATAHLLELRQRRLMAETQLHRARLNQLPRLNQRMRDIHQALHIVYHTLQRWTGVINVYRNIAPIGNYIPVHVQEIDDLWRNFHRLLNLSEAAIDRAHVRIIEFTRLGF